MTECTYCGSDLGSYDPVFVERATAASAYADADRDDERVSVGAFCNYACLSAHIDDEGLTDGTACAWEP